MPDSMIPRSNDDSEEPISRHQFVLRYFEEHDLPNRYWRATKREKQRMLDAAVEATRYHRKALIRLLKRLRDGLGRIATRPGRPRYSEAARAALVELWELMGCPSERKLKGSLPVWTAAMQRCGTLHIADEVVAELHQMSSATMGRIIRERPSARKRYSKRAQPRNHVQAATPLRAWDEWENTVPGEVQVDTVFHAGGQGGGGHLYSVTVTEPFSGWSVARAILSLSARDVVPALDRLFRQSPVPWVSIHTDNGAEFLNRSFPRWAKSHGIEHTRGRPGKSDDQAYIENANRMFSRALVGDLRYEGREAMDLINETYEVGANLTNFFMANTRLTEKVPKQNGRRGFTLRYDAARTPYARLCEAGVLDADKLRGLDARFASMNPVELMAERELLRDRLWELGRHTR